MYSSQAGHVPEELGDARFRRGLVGALGAFGALLEERRLGAHHHDAAVVDHGGLGRHEPGSTSACLDLAHRLAVVRFAAEEQDRAVRVADGRSVEWVKSGGFHAQGEHGHDDLLDRAGRPRAEEGHDSAVVRDRLRPRLVPEDVRLGQAHGRLQPDVGEPVVQEAHVIEDMLARLVAEHVDPEPGGPGRQFLGQLERRGDHAILAWQTVKGSAPVVDRRPLRTARRRASAGPSCC